MALPAPNLDDRTFQDIVDEAKRLIPRYCPEWTNHNVSDPGVALIELFAWMSEMVLFRLNQVPDRLYVHFLNLVGIEPFPPSVARADLTFWLSTALDRAGRRARPAPQVAPPPATAGDTVVFTTARDLVIAPPVLHAALVARGRRRAGSPTSPRTCATRRRALSVLPRSADAPGDALLRRLPREPGRHRAAPAGRRQRRGHRRRPAATRRWLWEVWNGEAWIGRRGLLRHHRRAQPRRRDRAAGADGARAADPGRRRAPTGCGSGWCRRGRASRPTRPRRGCARWRPRRSAAPCWPSTPRGCGQESSAAATARPGRRSGCAVPPVLPRRGRRDACGWSTSTVPADWTEVADFTESGPTDRHVVWDSATGVVRFGPRVRYADGSMRQHGAVPRDGAEIAGHRLPPRRRVRRATSAPAR